MGAALFPPDRQDHLRTGVHENAVSIQAGPSTLMSFLDSGIRVRSAASLRVGRNALTIREGRAS